ncbi:LysR family transcriptional regulator, partial [Vibrio vulnificus]
HRSVLADHMTSPFELSASRIEDRAIYDVDSLFASLDLSKSSHAIMPYRDRMCEWMAAKEIATLVITRQQLGTIGIYTAQGELD